MTAPTGPFSPPTTDFTSAEIDGPMFTVARNGLIGGKTFGRTFGQGVYEGRFTTNQLDTAEVAKWKSLFANLRSGTRALLMHDVRREYPISYTTFDGVTRSGGGAFDGTASLDVITSQYEVDIDDLPASFLLKEGDWIGFVEDGRYSLHIIVQDETATVGGVATLYIEPQLPSIFTTDAVVNFYKPKAEFVVTSQPTFGEGVLYQTVSFTGVSRSM